SCVSRWEARGSRAKTRLSSSACYPLWLSNRGLVTVTAAFSALCELGGVDVVERSEHLRGAARFGQHVHDGASALHGRPQDAFVERGRQVDAAKGDAVVLG